MKNRISIAQKAFQKKDVQLSKKAHSKKVISDYIHREEHQKEKGEYVGDFVYGALDGIVTTFAVVAGAAGAEISGGIVLIMGFANLFADGVSMALGNYLSTKSEIEYARKERAREMWEIEHMPEAEREEIRAIFARKGFKQPLLEKVVEVITADKKVWTDTMMKDELHIFTDKKSPFGSSAVTFTAFVVAGFFPLLPYVINYFLTVFIPIFENPFQVSIYVTGAILFITGSLRALVIDKKWWRAGMEMLLVGSIAALIAYLVGDGLRGLA